MEKLSVKEWVEKHNDVLTRRGKKMSVSYIYRLIRNDARGNKQRPLWFKYIMEGEKDNIYIVKE